MLSIGIADICEFEKSPFCPFRKIPIRNVNNCKYYSIAGINSRGKKKKTIKNLFKISAYFEALFQADYISFLF